MGEIKSVKVDNWGVFFLQKLQNFFNKTDYCDLTLQFKDNSQLKVHRLVLSACTDFFNVLEQTCEFVDDALVMPNELQADVVVPIVNFMYTGTLEFELKMYGKLLKTAKEMNMTVLLKLLEAHRRTMEGVTKGQRPASPKGARGRTRGPGGPPQRIIVPSASSSNTAGTQQRRILTIPDASTPRRAGQMSTTTAGTMTNKPTNITYFRQQNANTGTTTLLKQQTPTKMQKGPTRFECADSNNLSETYETSFDSISYESKPIKAEEEDDYSIQSSISPVKKRSSPFEKLRSEGYSNNKRPANITLLTPPAKKPNIEDVKEFAEQQRMRKQIAAEYGDDQEYDGLMDDDIHNDDDDDDCAIGGGGGTVTTSIVTVGQTPQKQQQQQQQAGPSVLIKQEPNEKPTIVVKDSTNSTMNHAKIISEVLRQYPHLVKSNKNIKLKIMPNSSGKSQKIIVKKETGGGNTSADIEQKTQTQTQSVVRIHQSKPVEKVLVSPTYSQQQAQQKPVATITPSAPATAAGGAAGVGAGQKRRIDSKTMHALIAQGAENTTGPWLCLRCGINGRPISIPSYRGFRRHLINTHKEKIDPALCEHCGWRSTDNRHLHYHMHMEHKHPSPLYTFPECLICSHISIDAVALNQHMTENHPDEGNKQQCIYCNKIFAKEMQLFNHMKSNHKQRALEDGIIDFSDDEFVTDDDSRSTANSKDNNKKKIKIISDISLPSTILKLEPSSEAEALSTVASGIATSIGIETEEFITSSNASASQSNEMKFVTADGNEMVLSAEQREQLLSQLDQDHEGSVVMVLNDTGIFQPPTVAAAAEPAAETTPTPPSPPLPPLPAGTATDSYNTTAENDEDNASNKNVNTSAENEDTMEEENVHEDEDDQEETEEEAPAEEDYEDRNSFNDTSTESKIKEENLSKSTNESKESNDDNENDHHMEWAENLISAQDMDDENEEENKKAIEVKKNTTLDDKKADEKNVRAENPRKDDDISIKLKMLTGDWSEDEIEDEDDDMNNSAAAALSTENIIKENISDKGLEEKKKIADEELSPDDCESTDAKKKRLSVDSKKAKDDNLDDLKTILTDFPRKKSIDLKTAKDEVKMDSEIKTLPKDKKGGRSDDDEKEPINKTMESKEKELNEVKSSSDDNKLDESSSIGAIKDETKKEHEKSSSFEEVGKDKEDHQINDGKPLSLGVLLPCSQASPVTVEETKSTVASDPSKTEDRMKSLISDWGDDDDDEDEDL